MADRFAQKRYGYRCCNLLLEMKVYRLDHRGDTLVSVGLIFVFFASICT